MKNLCLALALAIFTTFSAHADEQFSQADAQALVDAALKSGAIDYSYAQEANMSFAQDAATPGEFIQFVYWLGSVAVKEGWTLSVNTLACVVNGTSDVTAFAMCKAAGIAKGGDAQEACWKENFWSDATRKRCLGK